MGCDYYKFTFVIFIYKDKDGKEEKYVYELDRVGGYIYGNEYDTDFQTLDDYLDLLNKKQEILYIYKNNKWLCLEQNINLYNKIIETEIDNFSELITIYKKYEALSR